MLKASIFAALALVALAACASNPPTTQPLPRNFALLQEAEAGKLAMPALVEFYSDYCMSCRIIRGEIGVLDRQYDGRVKFIYIDTELPATQPLMAKYNVRGVPAFAFIDRRGSVVSTAFGLSGEQTITHTLNLLTAQP